MYSTVVALSRWSGGKTTLILLHATFLSVSDDDSLYGLLWGRGSLALCMFACKSVVLNVMRLVP